MTDLEHQYYPDLDPKSGDLHFDKLHLEDMCVIFFCELTDLGRWRPSIIYPRGLFGEVKQNGALPDRLSLASFYLPLGINEVELPPKVLQLGNSEYPVVDRLLNTLWHRLARQTGTGPLRAELPDPEFVPSGAAPDFSEAMFGLECFPDGTYLPFQPANMRTREALQRSLSCWERWASAPENDFLKRCLSYRFSYHLLYQPIFFACDSRLQKYVLGKFLGSTRSRCQGHVPLWSQARFLQFLDTVSPTQVGVLSTMLRLGLINMEWIHAAFASMPLTFLDFRSAPFYLRNLNYFARVEHAGLYTAPGLVRELNFENKSTTRLHPFDDAIRLGSETPVFLMDFVTRPFGPAQRFYCDNVWEDQYNLGEGWAKVVFPHFTTADLNSRQSVRLTRNDPNYQMSIMANCSRQLLHLDDAFWVAFGYGNNYDGGHYRGDTWRATLFTKSQEFNRPNGVANDDRFLVLPIQHEVSKEWSYHALPYDVTRIPPPYYFNYVQPEPHPYLTWGAQNSLEANLPWFDPVFDLRSGPEFDTYLLWRELLFTQVGLPLEILHYMFFMAYPGINNNPWRPPSSVIDWKPPAEFDSENFSYVPPRFAQLLKLCRVLDNALLNLILEFGYTGKARFDDPIPPHFEFNGVHVTEYKWCHSLPTGVCQI